MQSSELSDGSGKKLKNKGSRVYEHLDLDFSPPVASKFVPGQMGFTEEQTFLVPQTFLESIKAKPKFRNTISYILVASRSK